MDIGAVSSATAASNQAQKSLSSNYSMFLKLLTTQLQNQDPLSPQDATKFTEQLVSYSQVEQQISTNTNLNSLIALTRSAAGANAVSYLGKTALTAGADSALVGGSAAWRYSLPQDASNIQIKVTDEGGHVVRTLSGPSTVGTHDITWDGQSSTGSQMPDGTYRLTVAAVKADGTPIASNISGTGLISEIDMSGSEPVLFIGSRKLGLADITGFKN
ncbi:MAG: flagellar hook assembly protein FlgD [Micropepsaceae bacterium]